MTNPYVTFLNRLAERMATLAAGMLSARVAGLHAAAEAEQQSELEDLARRYEADGKNEIARTLRERVGRLSSTNLASEAVDVLDQVTANPVERPALGVTTSAQKALPDFTAPARARKRGRQADAASASLPQQEPVQ